MPAKKSLNLPPRPAAPPITGADELDLEIQQLLDTTLDTPETKSSTLPAGGTSYPTHICIYPEDNFYDLKNKIYIASGIPTYRQHIFYLKHDIIHTTYIMKAGTVIPIDIRQLSSFETTIHDIPIDKHTYELRHSIHIEDRDTFDTLESLPANPTIYVVDLDQILSRSRSQIKQMIRDTYQTEIFYYGLVMKFWPQLTYECFVDYITKEEDLHHKYPDLAKNKQTLATIYKNESTILNFDYTNNPTAYPHLQDAIHTSILQATTITTCPDTSLNIRNLFEKLSTSPVIPEIHGYITKNNTSYLLRKRFKNISHDILFPVGNLMKSGLTLSVLLSAPGSPDRYLFLNITANGTIYIKSSWTEEDKITFKNIIKIIKKTINPTILLINALGRYVFNSQRQLPFISATTTTFYSLNMCIYWKSVMLGSSFKILKSMWEPYILANIANSRPNQQYDKFEFNFRKGIFQFDTSAIERIIIASNKIVLNNQYLHLSNSAVKQKWDQNYNGRIVKMSHRTTDIRFEIIGIREIEFNTFYRYIIGFVNRATLNKSITSSHHTAGQNVKKLKKLKEQDPELYNLKKHGLRKVYSKICQSQKQPVIYTDDEITAVNSADLKKLKKYWNFTLDRPAFYGCPNQKYPNLSFIVGVHPKKYCLPCCSKKIQNKADSTKNEISTTCLAKHKYTPTTKPNSRHIMKYGKEVDVGRLSRLPASVISLFGSSDSLFLFGVHQHLPSLNHIGLFHCIIHATELTSPQFITKIIQHLSPPDGPSPFPTLLQGQLSTFFVSADTFTSALKSLFTNALSDNGNQFKQWNELFIELADKVLGLIILPFIDETGKGAAISLYSNNTPLNARQHKTYLPVLKSVNNWYSIYAVDPELYAKNLEINQKIFSPHDHVTVAIFQMLDQPSYRPTKINLDLISQLCATNGWTIVKKFINLHNLCYAVLLTLGNPARPVYVSIRPSSHTPDSCPITFQPLEKSTILPYADLLHFFATFNSAHAQPRLTITHYVSISNIPIAAACGDLVFYFSMPAALDPTIPTIPENHDYRDLNVLISKRSPPTPDNRSNLSFASYYNNYIYKLLILQFVSYLDSERNATIRDSIKKLITTTPLSQLPSTFRSAYSNIPVDLPSLEAQISDYCYLHGDKNILISSIDNTIYNFDHITINHLTTSPNIKNDLSAIISKITTPGPIPASGHFSNILSPCGTSEPYCSPAGKLIIDNRVNKFVEILAEEISQPNKLEALLRKVWSTTYVNMFEFTRRPEEILTIYRLT